MRLSLLTGRGENFKSVLYLVGVSKCQQRLSPSDVAGIYIFLIVNLFRTGNNILFYKRILGTC